MSSLAPSASFCASCSAAGSTTVATPSLGGTTCGPPEVGGGPGGLSASLGGSTSRGPGAGSASIGGAATAALLRSSSRRFASLSSMFLMRLMRTADLFFPDSTPSLSICPKILSGSFRNESSALASIMFCLQNSVTGSPWPGGRIVGGMPGAPGGIPMGCICPWGIQPGGRHTPSSG